MNIDLSGLEETLSGFTDKVFYYKDLQRIFDSLPDEIKSVAISWGSYDTVFRDAVHVYLKDHKDLLK